MLAAFHGHDKCIKVLLDGGADANMQAMVRERICVCVCVCVCFSVLHMYLFTQFNIFIIYKL